MESNKKCFGESEDLGLSRIRDSKLLDLLHAVLRVRGSGEQPEQSWLLLAGESVYPCRLQKIQLRILVWECFWLSDALRRHNCFGC